MITLIDEEKMVLKNYDDIMKITMDDIDKIIVDYNFSLDRKIYIEFCTMSYTNAYISDVI